MADKKKAILDNPFIVRQAGLDYGPGMGAILGYLNQDAADLDVADRNERAEKMGLEARYEVVAL